MFEWYFEILKFKEVDFYKSNMQKIACKHFEIYVEKQSTFEKCFIACQSLTERNIHNSEYTFKLRLL